MGHAVEARDNHVKSGRTCHVLAADDESRVDDGTSPTLDEQLVIHRETERIFTTRFPILLDGNTILGQRTSHQRLENILDTAGQTISGGKGLGTDAEEGIAGELLGIDPLAFPAINVQTETGLANLIEVEQRVVELSHPGPTGADLIVAPHLAPVVAELAIDNAVKVAGNTEHPPQVGLRNGKRRRLDGGKVKASGFDPIDVEIERPVGHTLEIEHGPGYAVRAVARPRHAQSEFVAEVEQDGITIFAVLPEIGIVLQIAIENLLRRIAGVGNAEFLLHRATADSRTDDGVLAKVEPLRLDAVHVHPVLAVADLLERENLLRFHHDR